MVESRRLCQCLPVATGCFSAILAISAAEAGWHVIAGAFDGLCAAIGCGLMIRMYEEGRPDKRPRTPEEEERFYRYFRKVVAWVGITSGLICAAAGFAGGH